MKKSECRSALKSELKKICDNVEETFVHPLAKAESNGDFPYITIIFGGWIPDQVTKYGRQTVSIIGIVRDDSDSLVDRADTLENDIINLLYKNEKIKCTIKSIDNTNLFKPFSLDAGVFPPYAGVRVELEISNTSLI